VAGNESMGHPVVLVIGYVDGIPQRACLSAVPGPDHGPADAERLDQLSWPEALTRITELEQTRSPRWVVWSARTGLAPVVAAGVHLARCWDLAEGHRVLVGGWPADPGLVWAAARQLDLSAAPRPALSRRPDQPDLFSSAPSTDSDDPLDTDGFLRAEALDPAWAINPLRLEALARCAWTAYRAQVAALSEVGPRALPAVTGESAAAVLCLELERDGLPVDRGELERLIAASAGRRPTDEADADALRAERDEMVLRHAPPGLEHTDLRNPAAVKTLLAAAGVRVETTRKWVLQPYRATHPIVDALLRWRSAERVATTYGYRWVDECIGADDRLRGTWSACDGAAGRMTAQNGLHSLPSGLRGGIAAHPGHVFVRADLGQIEPRVLAVVSGDTALASATRSDDLYAPVATRLGVERAVAKVAVLAAMYGQRSGTAAEALSGLERAYPVAMRRLDAAYRIGVQRGELRTYGGRRVPLDWPGADGAQPAGSGAARGRFARNAIIQGSAAELFKAWAATVRHGLRATGGQIVLCLHDELLLHVPEPAAAEAVQVVHTALDAAARRWSGSESVRFVADVAVVQRWSQAKG
jgi:DNA polymerase-1